MNEPPPKPEPPPLAIGEWVHVEGLFEPALIVAMDERKKRARVALRSNEWNVSLKKIRRADGPPRPTLPPVSVSSGAVYHQVDLHGLRVEEALEEAARGIDQALVHRLDKFKIIHGHGSGRLRIAIREMLATHPHVALFRFGEPHEGGLACTIAMLK